MTADEAFKARDAAEAELEKAKEAWNLLEDEMNNLRARIDAARWNYEKKRTLFKQAEERVFYTLYPNEKR